MKYKPNLVVLENKESMDPEIKYFGATVGKTTLPLNYCFLEELWPNKDEYNERLEQHIKKDFVCYDEEYLYGKNMEDFYCVFHLTWEEVDK